MKKCSLRISVLITIVIIFAPFAVFHGCGGGSSGGNNSTPVIDDDGDDQDNSGGEDTGETDQGDNGYIGDSIVGIAKIDDYGLTADFEITLDFSQFLASGEMFFKGQDYPNGPWIYYPIERLGNVPTTGFVTIEWPKGQPIEFSYGIVIAGAENWIDPSGSQYKFNGHFMITLGAEELCKNNSIQDDLVSDIIFIKGNTYRVYLNFANNLPIRNYQKLFVNGQNSPNGQWISYTVVDDYPCYYFNIDWPNGGGPFEFSFGIIKEDGTEQWIDPTSSIFFYNGHLVINLGI